MLTKKALNRKIIIGKILNTRKKLSKLLGIYQISAQKIISLQNTC